MKTHNTANIVLSNLDTLTENTLAYFINSNLCQNAKLALSQKNIHIYMLDLDRSYDNDIIDRAELNQQYIIGIHINKSQEEISNRTTLVKKPLNVPKLIEAIDKAHSCLFKPTQKPTFNTPIKYKIKISHKDQIHRNLYSAIDDENTEDDVHLRYKAQQYVGHHKDINPEKDNVKLIYFKTDNYFYTHLIKASNIAKSNKQNTITKTSLGNIIYNFKKNSLHHTINDNKLKLLKTTPLISPVSISFIKTTNLLTETPFNATNFIWDASIRTSKGRLPENTSLTKPVEMVTWPNFSQLRIFRHAIPIAATWSRQKISLVETAKLLKIPQRYVFSLYCAMNALGYAKIYDSQSDISQVQTNNKSPLISSSKLFSKILNHIFKRN